MSYSIPTLPLSIDLETTPVLKKLAKANRALAELKGVSGIIPNQSILVSTLSLKYLEELVKLGLLTKLKLGKENFYLNAALFDLLANAGRAL